MPVDRVSEYETIYIMRPDANDEERTSARDRLDGVVDDRDGHVLKFDDWGRRDLAYEVRDSTSGNRYNRAVYHYHRYIGPSDTVAEIERNLNLLDVVLKFMTVKLDDDLIAEERLARPEDDQSEALPYEGEEEE